MDNIKERKILKKLKKRSIPMTDAHHTALRVRCAKERHNIGITLYELLEIAITQDEIPIK